MLLSIIMNVMSSKPTLLHVKYIVKEIVEVIANDIELVSTSWFLLLWETAQLVSGAVIGSFGGAVVGSSEAHRTQNRQHARQFGKQ